MSRLLSPLQCLLWSQRQCPLHCPRRLHTHRRRGASPGPTSRLEVAARLVPSASTRATVRSMGPGGLHGLPPASGVLQALSQPTLEPQRARSAERGSSLQRTAPFARTAGPGSTRGATRSVRNCRCRPLSRCRCRPLVRARSSSLLRHMSGRSCEVGRYAPQALSGAARQFTRRGIKPTGRQT